MATRARPVCRWRSERRKRRRSTWPPVTRRSPTAAGTSGTPRSSRSRIASGEDVVDPYEPPEPTQVISPQAAYITTNILAGNTNRNINPFWGKFALKGPGGDRRPATLKTGTNNDAKDLNAYGFIAPPTREQRKDGEYALVVGAWNGNSDNSEVSTPNNPLFSVDVATYVWQGFLQETTKDWPIRNFRRPEEGLVKVSIDPFTGYLPQRGDEGVEEWFIVGTEPKNRLPREACGREVLELLAYESKFPQLAGVGPRLAAACTARPGRGGRSRPHRASPTSTTTASTPSAASGARSWARTAPNRRRSPPAFRCRARTPAG